jgi:uncharacterized MAPEG superfamily protein
MSASALALVGYAAWALLLLGATGAVRSGLVLSGKRAPNSFGQDGSDISPFANRLTRAHANCYENLPVAGVLVLVALVTGNAPITDPLALWLLAARVAQSSIHIASTSNVAVQARFAFFLVQMLIQLYWAFSLLRAGLA